MIGSSDSDSEDDKRVIRSAKDRRFDELQATCHEIRVSPFCGSLLSARNTLIHLLYTVSCLRGSTTGLVTAFSQARCQQDCRAGISSASSISAVPDKIPRHCRTRSISMTGPRFSHSLTSSTSSLRRLKKSQMHLASRVCMSESLLSLRMVSRRALLTRTQRRR